MKPFALRSALQVLLPAALLIAGCSKDDKPAPTPAPDQARIVFVHAAPSANIAVKFLVDDSEKGQVAYGANTGYQSVLAGTARSVKVNVASSGTNALTQTIAVGKDLSYSFFAYTPAAGIGVAGVLIPDDLTVPASGSAKVRVVHLAPGAPATVRLSQSTIAGAVDLPGASATFGGASQFITIPAGPYNLLVTAGSPSTTLLNVGNGTGTGLATETKTYESGKIYTVAVWGNSLPTNLDPALQPRAVVIVHN